MKYLIVLWEAIARLLSSLCFSKRCMLCRAPAVYEPLCPVCRTHLLHEVATSLSARRCSCCGRLLLSEQQVCTECRKEDAVFCTGAVSDPLPIMPYLGKKKRLLTTWKIAGDRSLSHLYSQMLFQVLSQRFPGVPVVPVPPRKNKIREKGWDQIEELCQYLETMHHVKVLRILERTTKIQQKTLNREERLSGMGADYVPLSPEKSNRVLKGSPVPKEVILLDDVITTGSTIMNAAGALHAAGVEIVHPVALFYVP